MSILIRLLIIIFLPLGLFAQSSNWQLKNDKDGVKVYYRETGGVYELKLVTELQTQLSGILQLFDEVHNYPEWGYKIAEARLLRKVSAREMYYYNRLDFPWPLNDRDMVMHSTMSQDPKTRVVTMTSYAVPDFLPANKDVERIRIANTRWILTPMPNGKLAAEYYIYSDPGGLPSWLINLALDMGPRETIKTMRTMLAKPQYRNARLAHVKE